MAKKPAIFATDQANEAVDKLAEVCDWKDPELAYAVGWEIDHQVKPLLNKIEELHREIERQRRTAR